MTKLIPFLLAKRKTDEKFKVGNIIKDFTLNDTSGNAHSFFELKKNNYVLLDFWASWCGPCRLSTPEIKSLLNKYGQYNFKVISISADTESDKWKKAIIKDTMNWENLSDLKGTDTGFMNDNFIFSFPTYVLVSPSGEIISRPFRLSGISEKLLYIFPDKHKP